MDEEDKEINPEFKREIVGGLTVGFIFMVGLALEVIGFITVFYYKMAGNLLWFLGTGLIIFTVIKNLRVKHNTGFKIANIIIKVIVIYLLTMLIILANGYQG